MEVVRLSAGMEHSLAATASGQVYSWGAAGHGRLGHGPAASLRQLATSGAPEFAPRVVRALHGHTVRQASRRQCLVLMLWWKASWGSG